jgi:hypothetical protein
MVAIKPIQFAVRNEVSCIRYKNDITIKRVRFGEGNFLDALKYRISFARTQQFQSWHGGENHSVHQGCWKTDWSAGILNNLSGTQVKSQQHTLFAVSNQRQEFSSTCLTLFQ